MTCAADGHGRDHLIDAVLSLTPTPATKEHL